jgi:hypothetical protein
MGLLTMRYPRRWIAVAMGLSGESSKIGVSRVRRQAGRIIRITAIVKTRIRLIRDWAINIEPNRRVLRFTRCWACATVGAVQQELLKRLAIVFYPTCDMLTLRVVVCPMDDPTFFVPEILAVKADAVAYLKSVDSRSDVDVVCHQQCLS